MTAIIIGITVALLQIIAFEILKQFNKNYIYALTLAGIGFLYVGYTWTDTATVIVTSIQAIVFVLIAYYGLTKNTYILAVGYFLHGLWDILYIFWFDAALLPPHYDWFCSSLDFVVGIYLVLKVLRQKEFNPTTI
ncbi:DUF6010 family protein [Flavobacterium wongokense]|uniref:DUF6010 family protein n=1 Tax=Flavobacterium wongokense TaxID=2910674 RepID=UPI001F24AAEF|nr:DUF6010 family protein [Flavobacterium sp. WG47]MCF6132758.1 DUF6010 family protein [Flavobacterium sp. WG47]